MTGSLPIHRARWTCPKNGEITVCWACGVRAPHRAESLAWDAPTCPTHNIRMVRAPETRP
jgi:hypothetical protein